MKRILAFFVFLGAFFSVNGMSSADLAERAKYLSFDGNYTGNNDPLLNFDGNGNWFQNSLRSFNVTITNNTDQIQRIALFNGYIRNGVKNPIALADVDLDISSDKVVSIDFSNVEYNGTNKTLSYNSPSSFISKLIELFKLNKTFTENNEVKVLYDGIIYTDASENTVTAEGTPSSIANLLAYIQNHPSWLQSMKITSTVERQFSQSILLTEQNPFNKEKEEVINLNKFTTNKDFNKQMIDIEVGMTINDSTVMAIDVVANSVLDITFVFGVSVHMGKYLDFAAQKASDHAVLNGASAIKNNLGLASNNR